MAAESAASVLSLMSRSQHLQPSSPTAFPTIKRTSLYQPSPFKEGHPVTHISGCQGRLVLVYMATGG